MRLSKSTIAVTVMAAAACATAASAQYFPIPGAGVAGAYWHLSKTVDLAVQKVVVDPDRSLSVIVLVRNNATYDFRPTPGDFIPTLTLSDGEAFTSRELFRPDDPATVFRPTIQPNSEVKIRFIFKKANGMAEPKTFTIKSGSNEPSSLDVSSSRWTSDAS